jgi:3-mercaptopyruvate sulfurtransferase SseA
MEIIKNNKVVIAIVVIILILVLIRSMGVNHFRNDAKRWAEPSVNTSNLITAAKAVTLQGNILIINLDKDQQPIKDIRGEKRNIPPDSVLSKKQITSIIKHNGPVLIYSSEPGLSARIWMMLSQMGCTNIFILTDQPDNESLKYNFQPDTIMH